jgi:signal transduction histidine kinase
VVADDGQVRLQALVTDGNSAGELPLKPDEFVGLVADTPSPRFFVEHGGALLELSIRRVQAAIDASRPWIVLARKWDAAMLTTLAKLTESTLSLRSSEALALAPDLSGDLVLLRPLHDWQGRTLRVLRLDYTVPEIERSIQSSGRQTLLFIAYGLLVLGALALALHCWVLRPLARIRDSLAFNDSARAAPLTQEKSEFGRVAELVISSFAQQQSLQREIEERRRTEQALARSEATLRENLEERARLGRDLHDGVIQSLYAAGMGLAGIRTHLLPEQTEAAIRLEQTRGALNETIHDVRNFIVGLEPEALKLQTFSQAVFNLLETMQSLRPFKSQVEMDDELSTQLSLSQRVHALQIAREAVSNALRHGEANGIAVALRRRGHFAEFEVTDDGRGFDTATSISPGNGLDNFAQRAGELGGHLVVNSQPGKGTSVKLSFSLNL